MCDTPPSPHWHLIGNGEGLLYLADHELVIRFNQSESPTFRVDLMISNQYIKGRSRAFELTGVQPILGFSEMLKQHALELERQLGVWPSLGLSTLFAMQELPGKLRISCMNLLPSIARPELMSNRKPLPCTYHNWLGERRLVMPLLNNMNWPNFWLINQEELVLPSGDPFPLLLALSTLNREEGEAQIRKLESQAESSWQYYATQENLKKAEALFYLDRSQQHTNNWWLYNYEASHFMSNIRQRLALAQQALFIREVNLILS